MELRTTKLNRNSAQATLANVAMPGNSPFFKPFIQPKLTINQPGDKYEQEADAVADKVMRMSDPSPSFFFNPVSNIQRKCAHCSDEDHGLQRKESDPQTNVTSSTENYLSSLNGGRGLSNTERSFFEPRMGADFSDVKIHTDTAANKSAQSLQALAYTTGSNIVFGAGQYQPESDNGKRLLAHELTHVVQQGNNLQKKSIPRQERKDTGTTVHTNGENFINLSQTDSFISAELDQAHQSPQPIPDAQNANTNAAECSYNAEYGNARLLPVSSCGGQIQFDILQVTASDKSCQSNLKGKQLSEVVTTDNKCIKTVVTTGPPVLLGDNGVPVTPATDTYGINMPREFAIDCQYGIPCPQEMKQELFVDGKLATTNIIRFEMCGDRGGCLTKIFINNVFFGRVGTGIYKDLSFQQ